MGNGNLQKIYADSTKKRTAQQTKWERAVWINVNKVDTKRADT